MTKKITSEEQAFALTMMTRRFATMINAGITLRRCLSILEQEALPPYAEAMHGFGELIGANQTLTDSLRTRADLFSPVYLCMMRAGEIGGILDEVFLYLVDLLELDWKYSHLTGWNALQESLLLPTAKPLPADLADLTDEQRVFVLMLFTRTFGMMLSSGVPILQSMEVTAQLLPSAQRAEWLQAIQRIRERGPLTADFLPPSVQMLIDIGSECGTLDVMMQQAGEMFRQELECRLWGQVRRTSA